MGMALASSPHSRLSSSSLVSRHTYSHHLHKNSTNSISAQNPFSAAAAAASASASSLSYISGRPIVPQIHTTYRRRSTPRLAIIRCGQEEVNEQATAAEFNDHSFTRRRRRVSHFVDAFWRFQRPHTSRGTILASLALAARAWIEKPQLIKWALLPKGLLGLVALICANAYIVGINQIYDVEIDKINKPYLPIASGDLSVKSAWILVFSYAAIGLSIVYGLRSEPLIYLLYCMALFLGTIYSVPPFRLKRAPVATVLMIAAVRGFFVNFGVSYSIRSAMGLTFEWSPPIAFLTVFVTILGSVVAILKDLSDVEGDRKYNISTLATKLGVRNIAFVGSGILLINYIGAIILAIYMPKAFGRSLMIPAHTILALALIFQAWKLERANHGKEAVKQFYLYIWNLLYAEYIVFPFI